MHCNHINSIALYLTCISIFLLIDFKDTSNYLIHPYLFNEYNHIIEVIIVHNSELIENILYVRKYILDITKFKYILNTGHGIRDY